MSKTSGKKQFAHESGQFAMGQNTLPIKNVLFGKNISGPVCG
jgi:hypothetical protein